MRKEKYDHEKILNAYIKAVTEPLPELASLFHKEFFVLQKYVDKTSKIVWNRGNLGYRHFGSVCDMGCGVGRPVIELARIRPNISFTGIDNSESILKYAKIASMYYKNVKLEQQDILDIQNHTDEFNLTYSTYNVIGEIYPSYIRLLLENQKKITKNEGYILNLGWNDSNETTEFLETYYPWAGLKIHSMDKTSTQTDVGVFRRFNVEQIVSFYQDRGIKTVEVEDLGLWYAVAGKVEK